MNQSIFNLLLIIILILLTGGILFLLYSIFQTLQNCCKGITPGSGGACVITYPLDSRGLSFPNSGTPNLLSNPDGATLALAYDQTLYSAATYPLRADLTTMDCTVKVVIGSTDPNFQVSMLLNQHNWLVRGIGVNAQYWEFFSYGPGVADGDFNLQGSGTGTIEVFENGSATPVKTITVQLN